jgi:hypothetical protein
MLASFSQNSKFKNPIREVSVLRVHRYLILETIGVHSRMNESDESVVSFLLLTPMRN